MTAAKLKSKQKKENKLEMTMRNDCTREFTTMKMKQSVGVSRSYSVPYHLVDVTLCALSQWSSVGPKSLP